MLKPLIFHQNELSPENFFLRSRIGAFEVQVSTRTLKELKRKIIFSKLNTRLWPSFGYITETLSEFMPKDELHIKLLDISIPLNEQDISHPENNFEGIKVILRPYRTTKLTLPVMEMENTSKFN